FAPESTAQKASSRLVIPQIFTVTDITKQSQIAGIRTIGKGWVETAGINSSPEATRSSSRELYEVRRPLSIRDI
ncbi:MAG: hypothetical protein NTX27_10615, partial [Verrucomicrobia bacterium]|nr:hypothetical protein [Verrucomicrobiota bacterium]